MKIFNKTLSSLSHISIGASLSVLVACGGGGGTDPAPEPPVEPPPAKADVNGTFMMFPEWNVYSPEKASKDEVDPNVPVSDPEEEIVGTLKYECTSTQYNLTETPQEVVIFSPNESVLWLGNLIQGNGYRDGIGSFTELSVRERAPLSISIDLLTGNNFRVVEEPSLTTVQSAIGELVQQATDDGLVNSSEATYSEKITHSVEQSALKFGISANYMGASATADLEYDENAQETTLTAYFYQKMFTASIELPPTPDDFFSDDFTQDKLDALLVDGSLGEENPAVYIANIAYGRILMYNFTSTAEESRIRAAITASYEGTSGGGSGYSEAELQSTLSEAKIEVTALGGESGNITALIREGNLRSYFDDDPALTSATPISYQLNQLKVGNPIAKVSESTDYAIRECTFIEDTAEPIGERIKVELIDVDIEYDCDAFDPGDMYGNFSINGTTVFNLSESDTRNVSSGDAFVIADGNNDGVNDGYLEIDVYYNNNEDVDIVGRLQDNDAGSDDNVGTWNFDVNVITSQGTRSKKGTNQCGDSDERPTLNYKVSRQNYIY
ncbi:MAG: thiol-activated cytolysin family protein [Kangiellaceae bacterium]